MGIKGTLNMVENYNNSNNKIYNTDDNLAFKAEKIVKAKVKETGPIF